MIFRFRASGSIVRALCAPLFGLAIAKLVVACGEDGTTPNCPELPLYNVREDVDEAGVLKDPTKKAAFDDAVSKNCVTPPGHATSFDATAVDTGAD